MKCLQCGSDMKKGKMARYQYLESGLKNVFLRGIPAWKCPECGQMDIEIPDPLGLHRALMKQVVSLGRALRPDEFRYLRTYLGLASKDLAVRVGVSREEISRWENGKVKIPGPADSLIRYFALVDKPIDDYRVVDLKKIVDSRKLFTELTAAFRSDAWKVKTGS